MGSDSIPLKTFWDESINQGLVFAHMHSIAQTKKSGHLCPKQVNASDKNISSMHHPQRRNLTTSMVGLKSGHIYTNLTQNGERQRHSWEHRRRRICSFCLSEAACPIVKDQSQIYTFCVAWTLNKQEIEWLCCATLCSLPVKPPRWPSG